MRISQMHTKMENKNAADKINEESQSKKLIMAVDIWLGIYLPQRKQGKKRDALHRRNSFPCRQRYREVTEGEKGKGLIVHTLNACSEQ